MKAILMVDVPVLDDGRHLCNECPIWNKEHMFCEYDRNMETKGCPLKSLPKKREETFITTFGIKGKDAMAEGWNSCLEEILGEEE